MTQPFLAAAVQLCSTEDIDANVESAVHEITKAARYGATLVVVPENVAFLRINPATPQPQFGPDHPVMTRFCELARTLEIDLVLGSVSEPSPVPGKSYNTSVYIGSTGEVLARYRKLHLFDIDIPGTVSLKESDTVTPGDEAVVVESRLGKIGMSICYDLRFPELYRRLTSAGARILLVPAAFTLQTGKDHWIPLLRARAIENQAWVIAPGQAGKHGGVRESYGKSLIIDPWGIVVAQARDGVGVAVAEIDFAHQDRIRAGLPCGQHRHPLFWSDAAGKGPRG
ncbi:MAG: carbon-nitrogen hydrolase family protein [Myxococcales bacterium]|nr:carbon-nitrogen hydrolase family protein [Myxococcales bacterium]